MRDLCKVYNLDDYLEPKFAVIVKGVEYVSAMTTFGALAGFSSKQEELIKAGVQPDTKEWIVNLLTIIFPTSSVDIWAPLHVSFLSATFRGVNQHVNECVAYSFEDLENFKKGKARTEVENG